MHRETRQDWHFSWHREVLDGVIILQDDRLMERDLKGREAEADVEDERF